MKFWFWNIVVVEWTTEVWVVVKLWSPNRWEPDYDVYVRSFNSVRNYTESDIEHFIYNKEITEDEQYYYLSMDDQLRKDWIDPDAFRKSIHESMNNA